MQWIIKQRAYDASHKLQRLSRATRAMLPLPAPLPALSSERSMEQELWCLLRALLFKLRNAYVVVLLYANTTTVSLSQLG